jgi:hypothetical protein
VIIQPAPITPIAFLKSDHPQATEFRETIVKLEGLLEEHRLLVELKK